MTLDEKLQQIQLLSDGQVTDNGAATRAKAGVGGVFSLVDPAAINELPAHRGRAVAAAHPDPVRLRHDPRLPDDLPDPARARRAASTRTSRKTDATIGARESATVGLKQIYSPMVDVSHEPRWGRIAEGGGEDPYLGSAMAAARVKGAQGRDYSQADKVVTSVKHYAAYGQPEGGRDYNTTDMSEQRLRNLYLPPFKAAIDAGADTVDVLVQRDQRRAGLREPARSRPTSSRRSGASTASSRATTRRSPSCAPARRRRPTRARAATASPPTGRTPGAQALNAGTDSEMVSTNIRDYGKQLLAQQQDLDAADRRRGAPHPAREVPRRAVRAPVRRRRQGEGPGELPHAGRPRRGAHGAGALDGAAQERRRDAAARPDEEDRGDRAARRDQATTCSARGGAAARTRTP